jgi:glycosyltransferase involved in cell wall biosynthesis
MIKVGIFVTHPIQYQVPLWQMLSSRDDMQVKLYYFSEQGMQKTVDPGFGCEVAWDVPLCAGYEYKFLSRRPIKEALKFTIPNFDELFSHEKFDVVMIHGYTHAFARQILRNKYKYGYKLLLHGEFSDERPCGSIFKKLLRSIYLKWFYPHIDAFGSVGKVSDNHLLRHGILREKIFFTPYSVDDVNFEKQKNEYNKEQCRLELGLRPDDIVFLFSGKLIPRKCSLLLAQAFLNLEKSYNNVKIIFLGSGEQADALKELLNQTDSLKYILPGFVNQGELGKYFIASDVFVLPSNFDAWGLVVNEAMHFGLPAIVSNKCGCQLDLITPGKTGYVFEVNDEKALTAYMEKFIQNHKLAKTMGANAFKRIQDYTVYKTANGIVKAIHYNM